MERTHSESEESSWKQYAIKQGYLIKFQRGLLKAPKMQYYVLTASGLIAFNGRPDNDTEPLSFLPYEQLSSIKLDHVELNSCKVSCMQLTSKTTSSLVLGFSRKEERDEWMMIMMKAFSEALLTTRVFNKSSSTVDEGKTTTNENTTAKEKIERTTSNGSSGGQTMRRKRRKGDKGSIRKSKSYDSLALHDVTNTTFDFATKKSLANPLRPEAEKASYISESRKRKSEPDIHALCISHFPAAWKTDSKEKLFANSCSFEHRDSLTVQAEKLKSKNDEKRKSNMFSKLRSKLEHPIKHVH